MSRIEKGGVKFRPMAKPKAPGPAASQGAGAGPRRPPGPPGGAVSSTAPARMASATPAPAASQAQAQAQAAPSAPTPVIRDEPRPPAPPAPPARPAPPTPAPPTSSATSLAPPSAPRPPRRPEPPLFRPPSPPAPIERAPPAGQPPAPSSSATPISLRAPTAPAPVRISPSSIARPLPSLGETFAPRRPDPPPPIMPDGSRPSVLAGSLDELPTNEEVEAVARRPKSKAPAKGKAAPRARKRKEPDAGEEGEDQEEGGEPAPRPRPPPRKRKSKKDALAAEAESASTPATPAGEDGETPAASASASADEDELSNAGTDAASQPRKRNRKRSGVIANDALLDLDILPGQAVGPAIDPARVTMFDIARQPGNGRVSARGIELQKRKAAAKQAAKDKEQAAARGEPIEGEEEEQPEGTVDGGDGESTGQSGTAAERARRRQSLFEAPPDSSAAEEFSGPQVRIVNGEIVLDEATLTLDQRARTLAAADEMDIVEEADQDRFINTSSFQRKPRGPKWTAEETEFFLQKVSEFGTDFQTIAYCFPGRSRNMIRNKYNRESRQYGGRLEEALRTRKTIDFEFLEKMTSANFNAPEPVVEESALDTTDGPEGERATSPGGSRSSRAGSASAAGHPPPRPRGGSQTKKQRRRSRSAMDEGLEVIGHI